MRSFKHIFTFDASIVSQDTRDAETMTLVKGTTTTVKCFKVGKTLYIRDEKGYRNVNAMMYLFPADTNVKLGYRIDGQLVQIINIHNRAGNRRRVGDTKILEVYTYA